MEIIIRNTSDQPLYAQIAGQIKAQILSGTLRTGDALPSIRALARDLRVSVITTKRAYDELEAEGYVETLAGRGCFVAEKDLEPARESRRREMEAHLTAAVGLAKECGVERSELEELLNLFWEEETP